MLFGSDVNRFAVQTGMHVVQERFVLDRQGEGNHFGGAWGSGVDVNVVVGAGCACGVAGPGFPCNSPFFNSSRSTGTVFTTTEAGSGSAVLVRGMPGRSSGAPFRNGFGRIKS